MEEPAEAKAQEEVFKHPDIVQNTTPMFITDVLSNGLLFIQGYGWFVLAGLVICYLIWRRVQPMMKSYRERREYTTEKNRDPDEVLQRQAGYEESRRRMQAIHEAKAAKFQEEQKVKEEKKRAEKIEDWEKHQRGGGYKSKTRVPEEQEAATSTSSKAKKNVYRSSDYNPLMGGSASDSMSYRPARRGGATGGG